jgi:hypothetical protein
MPPFALEPLSSGEILAVPLFDTPTRAAALFLPVL